MKRLIDLEHPFFAPLWIRMAIVVVTLVWGMFEMSRGAPMWGIIFLGVSIICGWRFATIDYSAGRDK